MGFWIFMTCMALLIPGILIALGSVFQKAAPMEINCLYGYRTSLSMKSKETWEFANRMFGRLAYRVGWILTPISLAVMLLTLFRSDELVGTAASILVTLQLIPLLGIIPIVERAMRKKFNADGSPKEEQNEKGK